MPDDLVPKCYWDAIWTGGTVPRSIDPSDRSLRNHLNRQVDELFQETLRGTETRDARALEIGCARSRWLPYFSHRFGFKVSGLDYSPEGCEKARAVAEKAGVDAEIICGDLFSPPEEMLSGFGLVYSFGVVEHFEDTAAVLGKFKQFLRPGGIVVTVIPNLNGAVGSVMRALNRQVFEQHVPLDRNELASAHDNAGLDVMFSEWFAASNFAVLNLNGLPIGTPEWWVKRIVMGALIASTVGVWALEEAGLTIRPSRRWSPYVVCAARRPLV